MKYYSYSELLQILSDIELDLELNLRIFNLLPDPVMLEQIFGSQSSSFVLNQSFLYEVFCFV
jgi:hypothetical protein